MSGSQFLQDTEVSALVEKISQLPRSENDVVLLLVAEHTPIDTHELTQALNQRSVPVVAGIFPGVIYGDQKYDTGVVASVLGQIAPPTLVTGLGSEFFTMPSLPQLPPREQYTALVLVDGLTKHVSAFLERLFRNLDNQVQYIGGGAGSLSFQPMPCLFDNHGAYQDAAVILWLQSSVKLGVRHGWQSLRGPFIATNTDGTIVKQLNRKPAFQVYNEIIEEKTGVTLTQENFFDIAKEHPLGIYHPSMDYIVRDPISFTPDGALVCVGEVPANSMIYVLQGNKQSLIDNARLAALDATNSDARGQHSLVIDCISRVLYLEGNFGDELRAVLDVMPQRTPFGMLTLGEIATFMTGRVEFFNKTIVVGALQPLPEPIAVEGESTAMG